MKCPGWSFSGYVNSFKPRNKTIGFNSVTSLHFPSLTLRVARCHSHFLITRSAVVPLATEGRLAVRTYLSLLNSAGSPWQPHYKHESSRGLQRQAGSASLAEVKELLLDTHNNSCFQAARLAESHLRKYSAALISTAILLLSHNHITFADLHTWKQISNHSSCIKFPCDGGSVSMALSCACVLKPQLYFILHRPVPHGSLSSFLYNPVSSHGAALWMVRFESDRWVGIRSFPSCSLTVWLWTQGQLPSSSL